MQRGSGAAGAGGPSRRRQDLLAVLGLVLLAALYLSPALWSGPAFGPFDLGAALSGLGAHGQPIHNPWLGDIVEEFLPWHLLNWRTIHQGGFPLWNPYAGLGMPQFFNFQSSVLSLPDLVSYALPAPVAFLGAVGVKLVLAGTGAFVFARSLGQSPLAAAFAGAVFELGGPFANEVGWPLGDVIAWTGWIFALALLVVRGGNRRRDVPLLALAVAFSLYGGFPEANVLLVAAFAVYFGALLCVRVLRRRVDVAGWLWMAAGWVMGAGLAAPLWLPGLQLVRLSERVRHVAYPPLPASTLSGLLIPGYSGYSVGAWFGPGSFNETVLYIGPVALVLIGTALFTPGRRGPIWLLVAVAAAMAALAYGLPGVSALQGHVPYLASVVPGRARLPLSFALAVLAGFGLDLVLRRWSPAVRRALRFSWGLVLAAAAYLAVAALAGAGGLPATHAAIRLASLPVPLGLIVLLGAVAWAPWRVRRRRLVGWALLAVESGFLLAAGAWLNTYSPRFFPESTAERQLHTIVGDALVGLTGGPVTSYPRVGVIPEMNVAFGLHEFAIYDPLTPLGYFAAWSAATGRAAPAASGWFNPSVDSLALAREFGVGYVLVAGPPAVSLASGAAGRLASLLPPAPAADLSRLLAAYAAQPDLRTRFPLGRPGWLRALAAWAAGQPAGAVAGAGGPGLAAAARALSSDAGLAGSVRGLVIPHAWHGMPFASVVGDESLYRAPGAARFSLRGGVADGQVTAAEPVGNHAWRVGVQAVVPTRLIIRLTNVPGWHASVDGRPARLAPWHQIMQQLAVPAGRHTVTLRYWPRLLTVGLWAAAAAALALLATIAVAGRRARG